MFVGDNKKNLNTVYKMKATKSVGFCLLSSSLLIFYVCGETQSIFDDWNKNATNNSINLEQSRDIYKKIKEEQYALDQIRIIVERHLKTKNAEILSNALRSKYALEHGSKLREITENIINNYDSGMVEQIFSQTMDDVVANRKFSEMPELLWRSYKNNDLSSYEMMVRFQILLYNNSVHRHLSDTKEFLQKFSYILRKILDERLYKTLNANLRSSVNSIVKKLPNNLKYLYFTRHFCLLNVHYKEYIYVAIDTKIDPISRYIWLWYDSKHVDKTCYIKAEVTENNSQMQVLLKSTFYKIYYYMMAETKKVAGWDSRDTPINHFWSIEFLDNDHVAFYQDDYLMCAVETYDEKRRNVGGRKMDQVNFTMSECQWRLGTCLSL